MWHVAMIAANTQCLPASVTMRCQNGIQWKLYKRKRIIDSRGSVEGREMMEIKIKESRKGGWDESRLEWGRTHAAGKVHFLLAVFSAGRSETQRWWVSQQDAAVYVVMEVAVKTIWRTLWQVLLFLLLFAASKFRTFQRLHHEQSLIETVFFMPVSIFIFQSLKYKSDITLISRFYDQSIH